MICLILFVRLLFVEQCNFKKCVILSMWYFIIICTPFFSKLNGKIMKMYVIDNKLLEVYCQVIVSIWVILYRCTWSYKNNGQLKHSQIECQLLWTLNDISPCCMKMLLVVMCMVLGTFQVMSFQISDTTVNGIVQLWRAILAHTLNLHYAQCGTNLLNNIYFQSFGLQGAVWIADH